MDILSKSALNNYVNLIFPFVENPLWKTLVDNPVDIVEKSWFSTGIPLL